MKVTIVLVILVAALFGVALSCNNTVNTSGAISHFPKDANDPHAWLKYARNESHDTFIGGNAGSIENSGKLNKKAIFSNYSLQRGGMVAAEDRLFVPNDKGRIASFDLKSGEVVWLSQPQLSSNRQFSTPTYYRGVLFYGTQSGGLVSVDADSGKTFWEQKEPLGIKGVRTCPSVDDKSIFFLDIESRAFCLDALTGKLLWRLDLNKTESAVSDPLKIGDSYFFGTPSGVFQAVSSNGSVNWAIASTNGIESTPVVHDNSVYYTGLDGALYGVAPANGSSIIKTNLLGRSNATPLVHNDKAIVSDDENFIYCVSTVTGEILWTLEVEGVPSNLFLGFDDCIVAFTSYNATYKRTDLAIPVSQGEIDKFLRKKSPFEVITKESAQSVAHLSPNQRKDTEAFIPQPIEIEQLKAIFPEGIEVLFARHASMYMISWDGKLMNKYKLNQPLQVSPMFYKGKIYVLDTEGFISVFECKGFTENQS